LTISKRHQGFEFRQQPAFFNIRHCGMSGILKLKNIDLERTKRAVLYGFII